MGKHFTINNNNLYIYITAHDELFDINLFPKELNLFEEGSAWRLSPWMTISENVEQQIIIQAEIILQLAGFKKIDISQEILNSYFLDGDDTVFTYIDNMMLDRKE